MGLGLATGAGLGLGLGLGAGGPPPPPSPPSDISGRNENVFTNSEFTVIRTLGFLQAHDQNVMLLHEVGSFSEVRTSDVATGNLDGGTMVHQA